MENFSELIKTRRSTRKFTEEKLAPEQVELLYGAGADYVERAGYTVAVTRDGARRHPLDNAVVRVGYANGPRESARV